MAKLSELLAIALLAVVQISSARPLTEDDVQISFGAQTVKAGRPFNALCEVAPEFSPLNMRMTFNGAEIESDDSLKPTARLISRNPVKMENAGNYSCEVVKDGQTFSKSFHLGVFEGVNTSTISTQQFAEEGMAEANITCFAQGTGAMSITWKFNNTVIQSGDKFSISVPNVLTVKSVNKADAGSYVCATHQMIPGAGVNGTDLDDVTETTINFTVNYAPVFASSHFQAQQDSQGVVQLVCDATAVPAPTDYTWFQNDTLIERTPDMEPCQGRTCTFKFAESLLFESFKCEARNNLGQASKTFSIIEGPQPGSVVVGGTNEQFQSQVPQIIGTSTDHPSSASLPSSMAATVFLVVLLICQF
jgi:hypothetical protein